MCSCNGSLWNVFFDFFKCSAPVIERGLEIPTITVSVGVVGASSSSSTNGVVNLDKIAATDEIEMKRRRLTLLNRCNNHPLTIRARREKATPRAMARMNELRGC